MSTELSTSKPIFFQYLSLFLTVALTLFSVYTGKVSIFYVIYLFWFDELIRTIFDKISTTIDKKNQGSTAKGGEVGERFFLLFIYFVFIMIFFAIMVQWNNPEMIGYNFKIFFFKNPFFNLSLLGMIGREYSILKSTDNELQNYTIFSNGIITLHLSIILGMFLWFLLVLVLKLNLPKSTGLAPAMAILPFLLLKTFFEFIEIKDNFRFLKQTKST